MINLLANDVWSERDIVSHTEALVHQVTPVLEEMVLNRKVTAAAMGQWTLTAEEQAELSAYSEACLAAHQVGIQMRADMALLNEVLAYEAAMARLALPEVTEPLTIKVTGMDGNVTTVPNPALAEDAEQRLLALAVVNGAEPEVLELYDLRHPSVYEVPDTETPDAD